METLLLYFPNITHYLQLLPVSLVAILAGVVNYLGQDYCHKSKMQTFKVVCTSAFLALLTYSILTATDLPYLAKVGISAAVGYFGIDKAIELVQKLLSLRNNNPDKGEKK